MKEPFSLTPPLILASQSPRRRALMAQAGLPCRVIPSHVKEDIPSDTPPAQIVEFLARRKAETLPAPEKPCVIIAADTLVCLDGRVLGKPANPAEAYDMLKALQGQRHTVYTGVALRYVEEGSNHCQSFVEKATVFMRPLSIVELNGYVATHEPDDKAGAYGVQDRGATLIKKIQGDYTTVMGLPLSRMCLALKRWGIHYMDYWKLP